MELSKLSFHANIKPWSLAWPGVPEDCSGHRKNIVVSHPKREHPWADVVTKEEVQI